MKSALRLEALRESGLLRKSASERLHHLAYTACSLLQADACQINALDDTMQRTVTGYPPNPEGWEDIPVELTGCQEVVLLRAPLVIPDVRQHPIMCHLPWAEVWQAYLGVPVQFDMQTIGSLCVLSQTPRGWRSYETTALEGLARLVGASLGPPVPGEIQ
jgi:GAF domain-containing protein